MSTLESKSTEMKNFHFSRKQVLKGYILIFSILRPLTYLKICWEVITTIIVYSPSVCNYLKDIIMSIRKKWGKLSDEKQFCIIAALVHLNKRNKVEDALIRYK